MKLETTCIASLGGTALSIAWVNDLSSIIGLIGTIISAVFGLLSLILLIYTRLKKKAENNELNASAILEAIREGKEGTEEYIQIMQDAIKKYQEENNKKE